MTKPNRDGATMVYKGTDTGRHYGANRAEPIPFDRVSIGGTSIGSVRSIEYTSSAGDAYQRAVDESHRQVEMSLLGSDTRIMPPNPPAAFVILAGIVITLTDPLPDELGERFKIHGRVSATDARAVWLMVRNPASASLDIQDREPMAVRVVSYDDSVKIHTPKTVDVTIDVMRMMPMLGFSPMSDATAAMNASESRAARTSAVERGQVWQRVHDGREFVIDRIDPAQEYDVRTRCGDGLFSGVLLHGDDWRCIGIETPAGRVMVGERRRGPLSGAAFNVDHVRDNGHVAMRADAGWLVGHVAFEVATWPIVGPRARASLDAAPMVYGPVLTPGVCVNCGGPQGKSGSCKPRLFSDPPKDWPLCESCFNDEGITVEHISSNVQARGFATGRSVQRLPPLCIACNARHGRAAPCADGFDPDAEPVRPSPAHPSDRCPHCRAITLFEAVKPIGPTMWRCPICREVSSSASLIPLVPPRDHREELRRVEACGVYLASSINEERHRSAMLANPPIVPMSRNAAIRAAFPSYDDVKQERPVREWIAIFAAEEARTERRDLETLRVFACVAEGREAGGKRGRGAVVS